MWSMCSLYCSAVYVDGRAVYTAAGRLDAVPAVYTVPPWFYVVLFYAASMAFYAVPPRPVYLFYVVYFLLYGL